MNWKLVLKLSLIGLAMAIATLFGLGPFELLLWLAIFILYAWLIATRAPGKYFLHGFVTSLINSVWITAVHAIFFDLYIRNNPQMIQNAPPGINPRVLMTVLGPVVGAVLGIVAGLFAFVAAKVFKRSANERPRNLDFWN